MQLIMHSVANYIELDLHAGGIHAHDAYLISGLDYLTSAFSDSFLKQILGLIEVQNKVTSFPAI